MDRNDFDLAEGEKHTRRLPTPYDPTGRLSLFDSSGVPSINSAAEKIFDYVQEKANSVGMEIKRNRGVPPRAAPENMLTMEEKAVVLLGRACGVVWSEIEDRIFLMRDERGHTRPNKPFYQLSQHFIRKNSKIIGAIQADLLEAVEAFSPLVGGSQRFLWRARLVEFYRRRIMEIHADASMDSEERDKQIRWFDASMRPHLKFFDKIGRDSDIATMLQSPSERAREQAHTQAEAEIERSFNEGEITDTERIEALRKLRHGEDE